MPGFSWKKAIKRDLRIMRQRRDIYKNNGRNVEANDLNRKMDRIKKDNGIQ